MASIPEEIWLQIFELLQNALSRVTRGDASEQIDHDRARAASVRPLTETCQTFHRICQPLLFETIVIDGDSEASRQKASCLIDVLHRKPHLKTMVSRVHICWTTLMNKKLWDRMESVLVGLCSIRDMWIQRVYVSTRLLDRRPRLERLVLIQAIRSPTEEPTIHSFDSLKYLRCDPNGLPMAINYFTALVLPALESLRIDSVYLTGATDRCDHRVFQFNHVSLKELIITSFFVWTESKEEGLVELLKRASRIKSLKLPLEEFSHGFRLPDDLVPDLETLDGRADVASTFCKGRPVRDLRASFPPGFTWSTTDDVPNLIQPGSVPLEHLYLDWILWKDDTMEYIARHCPQLVSLKIRAERVDHMDGTLTTRYPMPKLRRATFLSIPEPEPPFLSTAEPGPWYEDDEDGCKAGKEAKLVQGSREFWPQLEYLRLDPEHFWTYQNLEVGWVQVKGVE
ncbi:hypothetical protein FRC04_008838 [Tulasnella sp. 424]|nr:hypothetical protein FRC04_008838 [Tulasnella sp. 424]KAG8980065.1 hypothetical protein FRC05_007508 [Tulasnella sp. 425]